MQSFFVVKFFHILFAIVAVGSNLSYGIWIARAARAPASLATVLRTIKFIDDRVANPCYALLLLSGVALVGLGGWSFQTPWVEAALVLLAVTAVVGLGFFSPSLRRQIDALDRFGSASPQYRSAASRTTMAGIATGIPVAAILFVMVFKPGFAF